MPLSPEVIPPGQQPHHFVYGNPISNRSDGFDVGGLVNLFGQVAVELNEEFRIEVFDGHTKELTGVFPIKPIEVYQ